MYQLPSDVNVRITLHPNPSLSSWLGGNKLGTLLARKITELENIWVTQEKYQQEGTTPQAVEWLVNQCVSNTSQLINKELNKEN